MPKGKGEARKPTTMNKYREALQKIVKFENSITNIIKAKHVAAEALQSESRMYTEDDIRAAFKAARAKHWIGGRNFGNDDHMALDFEVEDDYIQSLKPKTEEQTYGEWMRSDPERPLYDFPNKKICFKSCEQSTIDLGNCDCHNRIMDRFLMPNKEQPTSPSIEKKNK